MIRLTPDDPRFPRELLIGEYPVTVLYADGDLSLLEGPRVSIIGSRHPSPYGRRVAFESAKALAGQGAVVVSGLAQGLDAEAHRGALAAGGKTIAVLGTGIDVHYPKQNARLQDEIREKGLLLTEYPPGTEPRQHLFPARNRIIARLCTCLLVVEGRITGGTSNTADWAGDRERIFAVPGRLHDDLAGGPLALLRDGALLYLRPNDILRVLGLPLLPETDDARPAEPPPSLFGAEAELFDLIDHTPTHVDAIAAKASLDAGVLLSALSSLELQGLITQLPGKQFKLAS